MKSYLLYLLIVFSVSLSFGFKSIESDKKAESKPACPYLQKMSDSKCPYLNGAIENSIRPDKKNENKSSECPYLKSEKNNGNSCPFKNGNKSGQTKSRLIDSNWKEIKS